MFGKFCLTSSYATIYVYSAELFPTPVRNVGVSTGSCSARIGGILAPFIGQLVIQTCSCYYFKVMPFIFVTVYYVDICNNNILFQSDISKFIPLIIFGALSLLAGLLSLFLPETKGSILPQTLKEGEEFGRSAALLPSY